jgi:hypothetical protein
MKHLFLISLSLGLFFAANAQQQAKRFAVKSAHIEYQLDGSTKGTRTIWFDNYGDQFYQEEKSTTTTKMFGMTNTEEKHTKYYQNGEQFFSVDLLEGSGTKGKLPYYSDAQEFANGLTEAQAKEIEEQVMNSMGGEQLGTENILGKKCEIISVMGFKSWIYKGMVLKTEGSLMGVKTKEIVTSLKENIAVPKSTFEAPTNIEYQDLQAMQAQYYGEMEGNYEDEDEEQETPLTFPYDKFVSATSKVNYPGYSKASSMNMTSKYMVMHLKGMANSLTILASSYDDKPSDEEIKNDTKNAEIFKLDGHKAYFGQASDEDSGENANMNVLSIEYPEHNIIVSIVSSPQLSKGEMTKVYKQLSF